MIDSALQGLLQTENGLPCFFALFYGKKLVLRKAGAFAEKKSGVLQIKLNVSRETMLYMRSISSFATAAYSRAPFPYGS